jgi:hypothetical protein
VRGASCNGCPISISLEPIIKWAKIAAAQPATSPGGIRFRADGSLVAKRSKFQLPFPADFDPEEFDLPYVVADPDAHLSDEDKAA